MKAVLYVLYVKEAHLNSLDEPASLQKLVVTFSGIVLVKGTEFLAVFFFGKSSFLHVN